MAATESDLDRAIGGLRLREIGPAIMGGRIADIAVDPRSRTTWYLAVGSGGVWKTDNAGVTWAPIFDDQPSYSIGCVALDPTAPDTVWVGTGENVSGRHVGWGDGVYKSLDGGMTWKQMGLSKSQHISRIVIDPRDGNVVYVATEGPLWSSGGERGVYKTTDGGETWERVLEIDDNTGVISLDFDPRDPDTLYAAAYQRRRHIWSLLAGGPGSGIYKTSDAGASWRRIEKGLPQGDMGKIGLAVSPVDPDVVYATIEADAEERGFYRSLDRGESWEKRNGYISGGTGPHYYQEIVASPHDVDRVYQMDVFLHITEDGGATFDYLGDGRQKHSDNHALWIDPDNAEHLVAGTDASLYESFDNGAKWRQFPNLPLSQFYKLGLDNAEPFYNILGGAQDLGTLHGPVRTTNVEGIRSQDWYIPLGADGYDSVFDPTDPDILYIEWQGGSLVRHDRKSDEAIDIRPMPAPGEAPERWNWDAPVLVSPHSATRLYFGSQRLWRSDDRGDSWTAVSADLTTNRNRYELEMIGRVWSIDALYDNGAMSLYATLTTLDESTLVEGLLYTGSDDGLINVSGDGGGTWQRASTPPSVPDLSFVNKVLASLHDADTVFAAFDAHKTGDLSPRLFESTDRGRSWRSITGNLPDETIVWSIAQDHVDPDLLFIGTEFGLYVTTDRGSHWTRLQGAPTISFRDVEIQRRDNDVVGATFGRGFYALDDYSPLRHFDAVTLDQDAALFPVRDAWWYVPRVLSQAAGRPSMGSDAYAAPNPPFGAVFSYHLAESATTAADQRQEAEEKIRAAGDDIAFPGWERLREESLENDPAVILTVRDAAGEPVRRIAGSAEAGLHRVNWDLRRPPPDPVDLSTPGFSPPWAGQPMGPLAAPGHYTVELARIVDGKVEALAAPQAFGVKPVPGFSLGEPDFEALTSFQHQTAELLRRAQGAAAELRRAGNRLRHTRAALTETPQADPALYERQDQLEADVDALSLALMSDRIRGRRNEPSVPSILNRIYRVSGGHWETRQQPTQTQRTSLEIAARQFAELGPSIRALLEADLPAYESALEAAGAPWTPGRTITD